MATWLIDYEQKFFAHVKVEADTEEEAIAEVEKRPWNFCWDWNASEDIEMLYIDKIND